MDRQNLTTLTTHLAKNQLFSLQSDDLPVVQRIDTSYLRARAIARAYRLTAQDVTTLSPKFWAMRTDSIAAVDIAPTTLLTIQYNLAAGTIAPWVEQHPEVRPILQKILDFEVSNIHYMDSANKKHSENSTTLHDDRIHHTIEFQPSQQALVQGQVSRTRGQRDYNSKIPWIVFINQPELKEKTVKAQRETQKLE
ncbi:hypothetical protein DFH08DRAFT_810154 [Mycena albidolilacea]|uniref:Uncharacterized protein n=1 Tax=Mycena albidolilacea TaxID=1033008 RepID=A0AAD7ER45_9AGAR|nr:hypothetical protein DFH08DRAFT_810154 [Mycena albidolilacea]